MDETNVTSSWHNEIQAIIEGGCLQQQFTVIFELTHSNGAL